MNNRYTFKAKTKQGKWVYGNLLEPKRMYAFNGIDRSDKFCLIVEGSFANGGWVTVGTKHWVLKETICQCTGFQDIDGNYIFENDIVSGLRHHNKKHVIIEGFVEYNEFLARYDVSGNYYNGSQLSAFTNVEIIGNKFDNEV